MLQMYRDFISDASQSTSIKSHVRHNHMRITKHYFISELELGRHFAEVVYGSVAGRKPELAV
jgi:hypothetical protein